MSYVDLYGEESWELDALEPNVIVQLVRNAIDAHRDEALWDDRVAEIEGKKESLKATHKHWGDVRDYLEQEGWLDGNDDA